MDTQYRVPPSYAALNDFCDAAEALPLALARHMTLMLETDAKSEGLQRKVSDDIDELLQSAAGAKDARAELITRIRENVVANLPFADEKDAIASVAVEEVERVLRRMRSDLRTSSENEFSSDIVNGSLQHPALQQTPYSDGGGTGTRGAEARRREHHQNHAQLTNSTTPHKRPRATQHAAVQPVHGATSATAASRQWTGLPPVPSGKRNETKELTDQLLRREEQQKEDVYCYCRQVSYGQMIGCDGEDCPREWFHLDCIGLKEPPKGQWFCRECHEQMQTQQQRGSSHKTSKRRRGVKR